MAIKYAFDLYPRADPVGGARVLRFNKLQEAEYRGEANGTGAGRIVIRGTETQAASIDPRGMDYIRVVRIDTAVVDGATLSGFSEKVVGGFFLENGDFEALTEQSTKKLAFGGSGALSYLQRAQMWSHSYYLGGDDPRDGVWKDTPVNPDHTLGFILWRWMLNAQAFQAGPYLHEHWDGTDHFDTHDDDRTVNPLPGLTLTFDGDVDSDSNAWTVPFGALQLAVGSSVLQAARLFMENGLYLEMDPDTFELSAWEVANHGRDRTGVAWGANVIRFQAPSAATVATGNIKSDAKRAIHSVIKRSVLLAGSGNIYGLSTTGGYDIPWEGFYPSDAEDVTLLEGVAAVQLAARADAGDTVRLRIVMGTSPGSGSYLPFEDILLDDLCTLHTGSGQWDWNESDQKVAALTIKLRRGGDWDAWVDLGSTYVSIVERGFQAGSGGCTCPRPVDATLIVQTSTRWKVTPDDTVPAGWHDAGFDDSAYDDAVANSAAGWYDDGSSRWIWENTADPAGSGEERAFRTEFYVAEIPDYATLLAAMDNQGDIRINDTLIGVSTDYATPDSFIVDPAVFVVGMNCISIVARNEVDASPGPAGIYAVLTIGLSGINDRMARYDHNHLHNNLLARDATAAHPASAASYDNATSGLTADDVQEAIDELVATAPGAGADVVVGWAPLVHPFGFISTAAHNTAVNLAANGGSMRVPMWVPSSMYLAAIYVRNTDAASARTWGWDLYLQDTQNPAGDVAENVLNRVAASNGNETFTPGAASNRNLAVASAPVLLSPGLYWLVIQNRHATNTFGVGTTGGGNISPLLYATKTTTNPNGATLDMVAATWTAGFASVGCFLVGRVFGQTTAYT